MAIVASVYTINPLEHTPQQILNPTEYLAIATLREGQGRTLSIFHQLAELTQKN
ncbi:MAG: hypothetical protein KME60_03960 [Cyanomargarita calcarea GSE-NOS-MK-12-04C]|jgi:hypothetical protein|uniref:Uncharacterized protein n=1 Tax=Cyanomargarita calcarea GSE-NOS-MK-12-04C TaxID=2839659 RepID=A0A951QJ45_9CYAN|nr:hypothetical protein [Cyanomargarita calcarea GSE-NOS-MK-12-04C]